jgi:hypothetical protein
MVRRRLGPSSQEPPLGQEFPADRNQVSPIVELKRPDELSVLVHSRCCIRSTSELEELPP